MFEEDVCKYRTRSTAKVRPRSKHKHMYETVLLTCHYKVPDVNTGKQIEKESRQPTKVCTVCGRIDKKDNNEMWYNKQEHKHLKWTYFTNELSEAALKLPVWHCTSYFDNTAIPAETNND